MALDAATKAETRRFAEENAALRQVLESHGVNVDTDLMLLTAIDSSDGHLRDTMSGEPSGSKTECGQEQRSDLEQWLDRESRFDDATRATVEKCRSLLLESSEGDEYIFLLAQCLIVTLMSSTVPR